MSAPRSVEAVAPGRVNLIGDHTDYSGGLCFPMAIDRATTVAGVRRGDRVELTTDGHPDAVVAIDVADPAGAEPEWARYVAGVVAQLRPDVGLVGAVSSNVPTGAGLSSSAALEVAVALALGADATDQVALAELCQAAEHAARGVPTGLLDQLAVIGGVAGHGLLVDCSALTLTPIVLPPAEEIGWVVVHTGSRSIAESQYSRRVEELATVAEQLAMPLRAAAAGDVETLADPVLRRRARHVVTENERVRQFAAAMAADDVATGGELMVASHRSLRDDYESSTAFVDGVWDRLLATPGVLGARITGAGWGGCVVAMERPGSIDLEAFATDGMQAWTVSAADGAKVTVGD